MTESDFGGLLANFFASVRNGDIDLANASAVLMRFLTVDEPFGGVRRPFFVLEVAEVVATAEVVDPLSLGVISFMRICRTDSMSTSVRDIRSRIVFQR